MPKPSVKLTDIIPTFSGSEKEDVVEWLKKLELVAELQEIENVAAFIPLFLKDAAFSVYDQLEAGQKKEKESVKSELLTAFSLTPFQAYEKFKDRVLKDDEAVDSYLADLRRLMLLTGNKDEATLKCQFISGLPAGVASSVKALKDASSSASELLKCAKSVLADRKKDEVAFAARFPRVNRGYQGSAPAGPTAIRCFGCKRIGHFQKDCFVTCYNCQEKGHYSRDCPKAPIQGNAMGGVLQCATGRLPTEVSNGLLFVPITVFGILFRGLIDSGCSGGIVTPSCLKKINFVSNNSSVGRIQMLFGQSVNYYGTAELDIVVHGHNARSNFVVADHQMFSGIDFVLGMSVIKDLGGLCIDKNGKYCIGGLCDIFACGSQIVVSKPEKEKRDLLIESNDFSAWYNGNNWVVSWKWKDGCDAVKLRNRKSEYGIPADLQHMFNEEVENWIKDEWLTPYDPALHGEAKGLIPFMSKHEPHKNRVRPIMDYRELNQNIRNLPGQESAVCQEKLRKWRQFWNTVCMLDLRKAYLQVHVEEALQCYQTVIYKGQRYVMTRMGFGLAIAPKVMDAILRKVISLNPAIDALTDNYIDDIICKMPESQIQEVRNHLASYGLGTKPHERLEGTRVLGLRVYQRKSDGELLWKRDSVVVEPDMTSLSRRNLYSLCGKLVGHYPIGSWLRVMCSVLKRKSADGRGDDPVSEEIRDRVKELFARMKKEDPVGGIWVVPLAEEGTIWTDASSLAIGVAVEIGGRMVEDACWLRKKDDGAHINTAELEAAIEGINLAIKWGLKKIHLKIDSAIVYSWILSTVQNARRIKVSDLGEMLVRRRLGIIQELIEAYGLQLDVCLVRSAENQADRLTRVPKHWLSNPVSTEMCAVAGVSENVADGRDVMKKIEDLHRRHHLGVDRTLYVAKQLIGSEVRKKLVETVIKNCKECTNIDPSPIRYPTGHLGVDETWHRLAIDITHYGGAPYLTIIDCSTRFCTWKRLPNEGTTVMLKALLNVLFTHGMPNEILSDNGTVFRSEIFEEVVKELGIIHVRSVAYRPVGNGIIERNHRTIKRMAARSKLSIEEMVFWYNNTPNESGEIPGHAIFMKQPQLRGQMPESNNTGGDVGGSAKNGMSKFEAGQWVYLKPPGARCTSTWIPKKITKVLSDRLVDIDGVNFHVSHIRPMNSDPINDSDDERSPTPDVRVTFDDSDTDEEPPNAPVGNVMTRSGRIVMPPQRYGFEG